MDMENLVQGSLFYFYIDLVSVVPVADAAAAPRARDLVGVGARVVEPALRDLPSLDLKKLTSSYCILSAINRSISPDCIGLLSHVNRHCTFLLLFIIH